MNDKQKKIIEYGIAIAIVAILAITILPQFISKIQTSEKPLYIMLLPSLLFYLFIILFAVLHYFILRKTLGLQYPFQHLRRHPQINPNSLRVPFSAYMTTGSLTLTIVFWLILLIKHYGLLGTYLNPKEIISLLRPDIFILLFASITTVMLLIFSNFFFAKPVKETWKAILLAGIIAGTSSFALSYSLWKLIGPYLQSKTNTMQSATE